MHPRDIMLFCAGQIVTTRHPCDIGGILGVKVSLDCLDKGASGTSFGSLATVVQVVETGHDFFRQLRLSRCVPSQSQVMLLLCQDR